MKFTAFLLAQFLTLFIAQAQSTHLLWYTRLAEFFEELVATDPVARILLRRRQAYGGQVGQRRGPDGDGRLEEAPGTIVGGEQSGEM
ncbi:MAG: hypothetical protein AAB316_00450, partial [Bacteroidota bacterium]